MNGSFQNSAGDYGKEKMAGCCCRFLEILCAILLPPLGVCFRHGCCSVRQSSSVPSPFLHSSLSNLFESLSGFYLLTAGVLHLFGADHTRLYPRGDLRSLRDLVCPTHGLLRPCLGPRLPGSLFTHVLN